MKEGRSQFSNYTIEKYFNYRVLEYVMHVTLNIVRVCLVAKKVT